jgi:hypothetical protein
VSLSLLFLLILLIHRKMRELENSDTANLSHWNRTLSSHTRRNLHEWNKGRFYPLQKTTNGTLNKAVMPVLVE